MFEITTEASFSAAHFLRNYAGPCENPHGHNWLVRVTVRCKELNPIGIGVDFRRLRGELKTILADLDHKELNVLFDTMALNPSSENIARYIFGRLRDALKDEACVVYKVEVFETPGNSSAYFE